MMVDIEDLAVGIKLVELHVHLRGTVRPALLSRLAARNSVAIPASLGNGTYAWDGFEGFLRAYDQVAMAIRTPADYAEVTTDYLTRAAAEDVVYTEIMVSPDHAADVGISYPDLLDALTEGVRRAREFVTIEARIVVTCVRHRGPEAALDLVRTLAAHPHPLVTGFGMAGDERVYSPRDFASAFMAASDAGLRCTCHAGEHCGPAAVWETVRELGVERLGHGVRSIEDKDLLEYLRQTGIVLEVCPTSNLKLGVYCSPAEHPLLRLMEAGCKVTINSDDPAHFDGSLAKEYRDAQMNFGLSDMQLREITLTAVEAAFCDEATKERLRLILQSPGKAQLG